MLGYFVEGLRKQGFALDSMLSRSKGNSMLGYLKSCTIEGKTETKAVTHPRRGECLVILGSWMMFIFDLCSDMITEWSCFCLGFSWSQRGLFN